MSKKKIINRRDFLKITGLATGGAALTANAFSQMLGISEKALERLRIGPGKESWISTACRICPGGCSLDIKRIDGFPIQIKGNTHSPINLGGTCPAAYSNLEILFHPDRFTQPLARPEGPVRKKMASTSWTEILPSITNNINALVQNNQAHKIAIINGSDSTLMQEVWENFANWLGTPNFFQESHKGNNTNSAFLTQGIKSEPKYDLLNSDYILCLGSNILEEEGATVHFNQVISEFKDLENVTRNKLVYVGPRANITAASAHKWIPNRPDTWGTLALGIAHILIDEQFIDLEYFRNNSEGFADSLDSQGNEQAGFETMIRSEFHPKLVEEITGISVADIRELAESLHQRKNPVVLCGQEALQTPRGELHFWAVHCLNYLLGSIQRPGGWFYSSQDKVNRLYSQKFKGGFHQNLFLTNEKHALEQPSLDIFAKRVEGYAPYNIDLLIINNANPVYYGENRIKWKALLKHIPRVIFIGDLPNDTSIHADVILPSHSNFETWDIVEDIPGLAAASATIQQPVIDPLYNTKSSYEILKDMTQGIQDFNRSIFPGQNAETLVKKRLQKIHQKKKGQLFAAQSRHDWRAAYEGHVSFSINESEKTFINKIKKVGGWWDPANYGQIKKKEIIKNPGGKFQFLHPMLKSFEGYGGNEAQLLKSLFGEDKYPKNLEKYSASEKTGYPLTLISGFPITNPYGRTVYSPTLVETVGVIREIFWESWAEINPLTAEKYNVQDGEIIQIDSPVGVIKVRARVRPIIQTDVIYIPLGLGRENVGRFSTGVGSDPRQLMVLQPDVNRGNMVLSGTPVRITWDKG
ncbi:MAG: molybdopterin-dependent oxidoreductase [Candidatus Neomarinimicrobiota bacterium]